MHELYTDTGCMTLTKFGEQLCGDHIEFRLDDHVSICVLADGLGSGVKANILATLTSQILATMSAGGMSVEECVNTIENLRIPDVLKIVDLIRGANKIYVLARGITALAAQEFTFQLQLQNYTALHFSDSEIMKRIDKMAAAGDLIILMTAYNSTPEFEIAARLARRAGCGIVVLCCKAGTPLEAYADVTLVGYSLPIVKGNRFNSGSRLPLQIFSRTIVEYLAR